MIQNTAIKASDILAKQGTNLQNSHLEWKSKEE